jgi:Protein of unknown function (DUF3617)
VPELPDGWPLTSLLENGLMPHLTMLLSLLGVIALTVSVGAQAVNLKLSDYRTVGNKVTFNATCVEDGETYRMDVEMMFAGDSFTGMMRSNHKGQAMTIKTVAKRIGDCVK